MLKDLINNTVISVKDNNNFRHNYKIKQRKDLKKIIKVGAIFYLQDKRGSYVSSLYPSNNCYIFDTTFNNTSPKYYRLGIENNSFIIVEIKLPEFTDLKEYNKETYQKDIKSGLAVNTECKTYILERAGEGLKLGDIAKECNQKGFKSDVGVKISSHFVRSVIERYNNATKDRESVA